MHKNTAQHSGTVVWAPCCAKTICKGMALGWKDRKKLALGWKDRKKRREQRGTQRTREVRQQVICWQSLCAEAADGSRIAFCLVPSLFIEEAKGNQIYDISRYFNYFAKRRPPILLKTSENQASSCFGEKTPCTTCNSISSKSIQEWPWNVREVMSQTVITHTHTLLQSLACFTWLLGWIHRVRFGIKPVKCKHYLW